MVTNATNLPVYDQLPQTLPQSPPPPARGRESYNDISRGHQDQTQVLNLTLHQHGGHSGNQHRKWKSVNYIHFNDKKGCNRCESCPFAHQGYDEITIRDGYVHVIASGLAFKYNMNNVQPDEWTLKRSIISCSRTDGGQPWKWVTCGEAEDRVIDDMNTTPMLTDRTPQTTPINENAQEYWEEEPEWKNKGHQSKENTPNASSSWVHQQQPPVAEPLPPAPTRDIPTTPPLPPVPSREPQPEPKPPSTPPPQAKAPTLEMPPPPQTTPPQAKATSQDPALVEGKARPQQQATPQQSAPDNNSQASSPAASNVPMKSEKAKAKRKELTEMKAQMAAMMGRVSKLHDED